MPALLAMAQAYALLKQVPKARTQLKRLAKAPWALGEAEDLEKSWLLLADLYCQGGKFDLAWELLRRCIQYNQAGGALPSGKRGRQVVAGRGGFGSRGGAGWNQMRRGRTKGAVCSLEQDRKGTWGWGGEGDGAS